MQMVQLFQNLISNALDAVGEGGRVEVTARREREGVECVALCDRECSKARKLAEEHGVQAVYEDAEELLKKEKPDFVDIITDVDSHSRLVHLAAKHKVPVICQKPMAPTLAEAEQMVSACQNAGVPMISLARLVVVSENADPFLYEGKPIFKGMCGSANRPRHTPHDDLHKGVVVKDMPLEEQYQAGLVRLPEFDEYVSLVCDFLERLPANMVIHRLNGDAPPDYLVAPLEAAVADELVQPVGEDVRRDAGECLAEVAEAARPVEQCLDEQQAPAVADAVEGRAEVLQVVRARRAADARRAAGRVVAVGGGGCAGTPGGTVRRRPSAPRRPPPRRGGVAADRARGGRSLDFSFAL